MFMSLLSVDGVIETSTVTEKSKDGTEDKFGVKVPVILADYKS